MSQRKNKNRQDNLNKFKSKHKKQMPKELNNDVRQYPVWDADQVLEVYGAEWDAIFNFVNSVQTAYMACSSVMNRAVLDGKVRLKFEKALPNGEFAPMTPEEEKPYQEQFAETVRKAKEIAAEAVKRAKQPEPPSQEGLPHIDALVDSSGTPISSENRGEAKIIQMGGDTQG